MLRWEKKQHLHESLNEKNINIHYWETDTLG